MSNQERQAAYRQVVQSLIQSPQNDEERILAANLDLVDEGLVKTLKDTAKMMMIRNHPPLRATIQRLVSFAQQLERKLASGQSEAVKLEQEDYIRFSVELLQIVVNSQGNGGIVHQFFDRHLGYLNEELLAILPASIAALLERAEDRDRQAYIESIVQNLSIDLQTYSSGDRQVNLALSIACKEQSSLVHDRPDEQPDLVDNEVVQPDKDRQTAYFDLVQALLECPLNQEDRVLADHPKLVDKGLVLALLEVAEIRKERNNPDSGWTIEWLEVFAEQLSQKLDLQLGVNKQIDEESETIFPEDEEIFDQSTDENNDRVTVVTPISIPIDAHKESHLGQVYFKQGEWQLAADAFEIEIQSMETSRSWGVDEQQQPEMCDDTLSSYENAIQCAINLENYSQAIEYTQRIRSRQLVGMAQTDGRQIQAETIDYAASQQLIHNPHTAILTCYTTNDDTHIFIIKQNGAPTIHTCKTQGRQKFQNWLQKTWINPSHEDNSNWAEDLPRLLHDISQRLELDTLIETHLTDINELIILPHLNLHQIPFAALPLNPLVSELPRTDKSVRLQSRLIYAPNPLLEKGGFTPSPWQGEGWGGVKGLSNDSNNLCTQGSLGAKSKELEPVGLLLGDRFIIHSIPSCEMLQYSQLSPPVEDANDCSVQSTLWSVDDYVSVIFQVMYHQERRKGTNPAISLRTAQFRLRNLTGAEFQHHYYPDAIEYVTKHHPTLKTTLEHHLEAYCEMDKPFASPFYWATFITQGMP